MAPTRCLQHAVDDLEDLIMPQVTRIIPRGRWRGEIAAAAAAATYAATATAAAAAAAAAAARAVESRCLSEGPRCHIRGAMRALETNYKIKNLNRFDSVAGENNTHFYMRLNLANCFPPPAPNFNVVPQVSVSGKNGCFFYSLRTPPLTAQH